MYYSNLNSSLEYVNKPSMEDWNPWIWRITAAVSGTLCGLAVISPLCAWLAWLAPAGFMFSLLISPFKPLLEYLWRACLFAFCYYAITLSGLLQVADYIQLPRWQSGLLVLLSCGLCIVLLSLLWLLAALIFGLCRPPVQIAFAFWPLACYLIEWLQGHLFGGFPVVSLGTSQGVYPLLCQSASCWGVWGLSGLIILINVLLAASLLCRRWRYLLLAVAIFAVNVIGGLVDWHFDNAPKSPLQVVAAHTDISFSQRWDSAYDNSIFATYTAQISASKAENAQLILLPETALPYALQADSGYGAQFLQLARQNQLTLVVGGFAEHSGRTYNSLFAASPGGSFTEIYTKRALVPFGEFIPFPGLLDKILPEEFWASFPFGNLLPGGQQGTASIILADKTRIATAGLICYDVCFADYPRQAVHDGAVLLLAASNDVWYRGTNIVYQHLNQAVLRAIEYGRPLINSTNGGYSAIIDQQGRILAMAKPQDSIPPAAEIGLPTTEHLTPFSRYGQYLIIAVALVWVMVSLVGWLCRPAHNHSIFSTR